MKSTGVNLSIADGQSSISLVSSLLQIQPAVDCVVLKPSTCSHQQFKPDLFTGQQCCYPHFADDKTEVVPLAFYTSGPLLPVGPRAASHVGAVSLRPSVFILKVRRT